jgi:hypothetical protein
MAGALISAHGSLAAAIATIGSVYLVGLLVSLFARETKEQQLPD